MLEVGLIINNEIYYKCSKCGSDLGTDKEIPIEWNYCPVCGERLQ